MSCGCKKDKAMVERKLQARKARKRQYESRKENHNQKNLDAKKAAFDEYIRTRKPIGYRHTAGGIIALYEDFVFPPVDCQRKGAS